MKYLIVSDSHGRKSDIERIIKEAKDIEGVLFLGDGLADIARVQSSYPNLDFYVVRGNCDISAVTPPMQILTLGDLKVMLCHGDGFDVKMSLLALRRTAISLGASVVLYGHTHKQYYEYLDGLYIFCPGSVEKDISANFKICYGIMEINDGKPIFYHKEIE